jgi:DNA polymerase
MDRDQLVEHLRFAAELGVAGVSRDPAWRARLDARAPGPAAEAAVPGPAEGTPPHPSDAPVTLVTVASLARSAGEALAALKAEIGGQCTRCKLHALGRSQVGFGVGTPTADLMVVGEAPGADEDAQGEPFVGRAGQLLTKIVEAMGFARADVYIANVIKCRPPGNRNPEPVEVATCQPFLFRQIDLIRPKVIVALGTFAAHALLGTDAPISRLRGRVHAYRAGSRLVPTFHPAFLLRSPDRKRDVWDDMKKVRALLAELD